MLWSTHLRITFEVIRNLGITLSNTEESFLREGVIMPDKTKGTFEPHHYHKSLEIKQNLLVSRGYFLKDDSVNAYYYLGIALHYIQDSHVSMASSSLADHSSWEESIENYSKNHLVASDLQEIIDRSLGYNSFERDRCLSLAESLANGVQGKDSTLCIATLTGHQALESYATPLIDYNLALKATF